VKALGAPRPRAAALGQRDKDIARSTQERFEDASLHCVNRLHRLVPTGRLAMAGGCALNGVANARILRETPFRTPYLQAASSDDGTCLGAAFWCYHNVAGGTNRFQMKHAFWGPGYDDGRLRRVAEGSGFLVRTCADEADLVETAA
jgi:carbamoyltransferase